MLPIAATQPLPTLPPPGWKPYPFDRVSPTQIVEAELCFRRWFNAYRLGIKRPRRAEAALGSSIHDPLEVGLKTGVHGLSSGDARTPHVEAALVELPHPRKLRNGDMRPAAQPLLVEYKPKPFTVIPGITFDGKIDLFDFEPLDGFAELIDHKTTKDFRYCKTPDELRFDAQLLLYAYWALFTDEGVAYLEASGCSRNGLHLRHAYIKTQVKKPQIKPVHTFVSAEHVNWQWLTRFAPLVEQMRDFAARAPETAQELPPTTTSCGLYGGCFYQPLCGIAPASPISNLFRHGAEKVSRHMSTEEKGQSGGSSLLARLSAAKANVDKQLAAGAKAGTLPPGAKAPEPVGDDAPELQSGKPIAEQLGKAPPPSAAALASPLAQRLAANKAPLGVAASATLASAAVVAAGVKPNVASPPVQLGAASASILDRKPESVGGKVPGDKMPVTALDPDVVVFVDADDGQGLRLARYIGPAKGDYIFVDVATGKSRIVLTAADDVCEAVDEAVATPVKPAAPVVATGIVPPDAGPRTTDPKPPAAPAAAPDKPAKPPKSITIGDGVKVEVGSTVYHVETLEAWPLLDSDGRAKTVKLGNVDAVLDTKSANVASTLDAAKKLHDERAAKEAERARIAAAMAPKPEPQPPLDFTQRVAAHDPAFNVAPEQPEPAPELPKPERVAGAPLVLFVNCMPSKGGNSLAERQQLFAEWLAPIGDELSKALGQPWQLVDYKASGLITEAMRRSLYTLPDALVIDTREPAAREALALLSPHAMLIIRGMI